LSVFVLTQFDIAYLDFDISVGYFPADFDGENGL